MLATTRKNRLGSNGPWKLNIEDIWPGDELQGIGTVSSIIDRAGEKFIRLCLEDGRVYQGYYGKQVIVSKLSDIEFYCR